MKYKIGIIERLVTERRADIEIDASSLRQACEIVQSRVTDGLIDLGDAEEAGGVVSYGTWDKHGEWHEIMIDPHT